MPQAQRPSLVDLILAPLQAQRLRVQREFFVALSSAGVLLVLAGMYVAGMLGFRSLLVTGSLVILMLFGAFALLVTGINRRFKDPSFTGWQTVSASTVLILAAFLASPEGHGLALLLIPVAFAYSSFRYGFTTLLLLGGMIFGLSGVETLARLSISPTSGLDPLVAAVHLGALAVSLFTLALVGGQFNDLRRRNRAERAVSHVAMAGLSEAVLTVDRDGRIRFMNTAARALFGCAATSDGRLLIDQVCRFIDRPPLSLALADIALQYDAQGANAPGDPRGDEAGPQNEMIGGMIERDTGVFRYIRLSISLLASESGRLEGYVLMVRDISQTRRLMTELKHAATHDPLTGLLNRRGFLSVLQHTFGAARLDVHPGAILAIDLDQFKMVNDACGHVAGDELLRTAARTMASLIPPGAALARVGGDEFGLVVRGLPLHDVEAVAARFIAAIAEIRFGREGRVFRIGASIGIAQVTDECADTESLLSRADSACFLAKQRGRNCARVYQLSDVEMIRHHSEMGWGRRIAEALTADRFTLFLQRIVPAVGDHDVYDKFEVLVRMVETDGSIVAPEAFLSAAERFSQIGAIDRFVVKLAIDSLAQIRAVGRVMPHLSINLSPTSLRDATLLGWIGTQLAEANVNGSQLTFELTETAAILDLDQALTFFRELRSMGCRVALDDVGSGFNSFVNLRRLTVDQIKIDGTYVRDACSNPLDRAFVESIQRIADILGVETVAEFVETDALRDLMAGIHVNYLQGFAVHVPEPLEQVVPLLPMQAATTLGALAR